MRYCKPFVICTALFTVGLFLSACSHIDPSKEHEEKIITAVGSSALDIQSGGEYQLTALQKKTYGVRSDLTMTRVMQVLLGYDKTNLCAFSGNSASAILFKCGLCAYQFNYGFTLPSDKTEISYEWNTTTISSTMTHSLSVINKNAIGSFKGMIDGINVAVDAINGTIALLDEYENDVVIPSGSFITRDPVSKALNSNGVLRESVKNSYGVILQIGANPERCTPEEIVNYYDLVIKESNCKWFICLCENSSGKLDFSGELGQAVSLLRQKYGSRYVDHRTYLCSLQALLDQGITPTTSADYPDVNGNNSNPLTKIQIMNGVKCDMQCIAEGLFPSSFWHSAYRDGEPQTINNTHLNAQGLECWGKYMVEIVKTMESQ